MTVAGAVRKRIRRFNYDEIFSSRGFLDLGPIGSVHATLARLVKLNDIKRVSSGYYVRKEVGKPNFFQIADAVASRTNEILIPTDELACWRVGLINEMPNTCRFITTGGSRTILISGVQIKLTHSSNDDLLKKADTLASTAYCALQYIGSANVTTDAIAIVRNKIGDESIFNLLDMRLPSWLEQGLRKEIKVTREGALMTTGNVHKQDAENTSNEAITNNQLGSLQSTDMNKKEGSGKRKNYLTGFASSDFEDDCCYVLSSN